MPRAPPALCENVEGPARSRNVAPTVITSASTDPCFASARELGAQLRARDLSARELMAAHLARIERINPKINAIVAKLDDDRCLALADEADRRLARGEAVGPLHGLPIAFKELEPAVGFPWTRGSTDLPRRHAGGGQRAGRAAARRRRDPDRQDQRARVRDGLALLQPRLRHDAQSLRHDQERGRLERRRRRRARRRTAADRGRQRPRRVAAQPGQLQQHRRAAAHRGLDPDGAGD